MKNNNLFFIFALLFISCSSHDYSYVNIDVPIAKSNVSFLEEMFLDPVVIDLKTDNVFSGDESVSLSMFGDNYCIVSGQEATISLFDSNGSLITFINKNGRGPGEYVQLKDVAVSQSGTIYALCNYDSKVITYSSNGSYLSERVFGFHSNSFVIDQDNNFIFMKERFSDEEYGKNIIIVKDSLFSDTNSFLPLPDLYGGEFGEKLVSTTGNSHNILCKQIYDDNVYILNSSGIQSIIHLDFKDHFFPKSFYQSKSLNDSFNIIKDVQAYYIQSVYGNDNYYIFSLVEIDGMDIIGSGMLVYDINQKKLYTQYFSNHDGWLSSLGFPVYLTEDDRLLFLTDNDTLSKLNLNEYSTGTGREKILSFTINSLNINN